MSEKNSSIIDRRKGTYIAKEKHGDKDRNRNVERQNETEIEIGEENRRQICREKDRNRQIEKTERKTMKRNGTKLIQRYRGINIL